MIIHDVSSTDLGKVIASLVREGLMFDCHCTGFGLYRITLTGGY